MGTTLRTRFDFLGGLVENTPLAASGTTLTSSALMAMPSIGGSSLHYVPLTLDPDGLEGAPEIVWVTDHNPGSNVATILRAQESTAARVHNQDTPWVHGPTVQDAGANDTDMAVLRANFQLHGGGVKSVSSTHIKWTTRFISIGMGQGAHWSSNGYYDITMPAVGAVIPGHAGLASRTVTTDGIPLADWQTLWFIPGIGGAMNSGSFIASSYTYLSVIPKHWVFVASRNSDDGLVRWGDGTIQDYWRLATGFANGWSSYPNYPARYRKLGDGSVQLGGLIAGGTTTPSTPAFSLPVGYRPQGMDFWHGMGLRDGETPCGVRVRNTGEVSIALSTGATATAWYSLDLIRFFAEA